MTEIRRSGTRRQASAHRRTTWHSFDPESGAGLDAGFGPVAGLDEHSLQPGGAIGTSAQGVLEVITYVHEGALSFEDAGRRPGLLRAGEFQHMAAPAGSRRDATNGSRVDAAHVFQVQLRSTGDGAGTVPQQRRFSAAERRGILCVIASPEGRRGSLQVQGDVEIFSALLSRGQHVVHEIREGRRAWLHVVSGEATLGDLVLSEGDGASFVEERAVSMIAREESEILLLDTQSAAVDARGGRRGPTGAPAEPAGRRKPARS